MSDAVEFAEVPELFERWLAGRPLAERSRREYARNVRAYCAWLAETPDRDGWQGDPLTDPIARDHAARDFRRWLQVERWAAASTVNLALASLAAFYRCRGLGRPNVRRDKPAQAAPRALDEAGQRLLLRAAEAAPIRARALVMLMLFTALRISETVALDVDDVRITTRKGVLVVMGRVRCGARCRSTRWCARSSTSGWSRDLAQGMRRGRGAEEADRLRRRPATGAGIRRQLRGSLRRLRRLAGRGKAGQARLPALTAADHGRRPDRHPAAAQPDRRAGQARPGAAEHGRRQSRHGRGPAG